MEKKLYYTITNADLYLTVKDILKHCLNLTARQISSAKFRPNGITVNGQLCRVSARVVPDNVENASDTLVGDTLAGDTLADNPLIGSLHVGDILVVLLEDDSSNSDHLLPTKGDLDIRFEDDDLIIINKPAGIAVHPSHGHYSDTLANHLQYYFQQKNESVCIRAVGRLDLDTSGLVVFAKNKVAAARLQDKNMIKKTYLALAYGVFDQVSGTITVPILLDPAHLNKMMVSPDGKDAVTHYHVIHQYDDYALLSVNIETGRTHQIRVHMASIGHPLLGDKLYGDALRLDRHALHCAKVRFIHPFSEETITVASSLPDDMQLPEISQDLLSPQRDFDNI